MLGKYKVWGRTGICDREGEENYTGLNLRERLSRLREGSHRIRIREKKGEKKEYIGMKCDRD